MAGSENSAQYMPTTKSKACPNIMTSSKRHLKRWQVEASHLFWSEEVDLQREEVKGHVQHYGSDGEVLRRAEHGKRRQRFQRSNVHAQLNVEVRDGHSRQPAYMEFLSDITRIAALVVITVDHSHQRNHKNTADVEALENYETLQCGPDF